MGKNSQGPEEPWEVGDEHRKKYFQKQLASDEFKRSYIEERIKLDIEYRLEELKKDVQARKSSEEIIKKIDLLERYVLSA